MIFATRLRKLRIACGLSITDLSRRTGIAIASLSSYEREAYLPSLENLCILADFFEVSLDYLMGRK